MSVTVTVLEPALDGLAARRHAIARGPAVAPEPTTVTTRAVAGHPEAGA